MCDSAHNTSGTVPSGLSNLEVVLLSFLESIDRGSGLPDGCDARSLLTANLIASGSPDEWRLTLSGRLRMQNLRLLAASGTVLSG